MSIVFHKDRDSGDFLTIALWDLLDTPYAEGGATKQTGAPAADAGNVSLWGLNNQFRDIAGAIIKLNDQVFHLTLDGNCYVATNVLAFVVRRPLTIGKLYAEVNNNPVGADLQIDANKNGTTVFTTQANRPIIADGTSSDESGTPDVTSFAAGDIYSIDIDQIGSTTPGGNKLFLAQDYSLDAYL